MAKTHSERIKLITSVVYDAIALLSRDASQRSWFSLDIRTRRVLLDRGYTIIENELPVVTDAGRQAQQMFDARHSNSRRLEVDSRKLAQVV